MFEQDLMPRKNVLEGGSSIYLHRFNDREKGKLSVCEFFKLGSIKEGFLFTIYTFFYHIRSRFSVIRDFP